MITVKETLKQELETLILHTKESLKNLRKVAIDEAWKILQLAVAKIVQTIEKTAVGLSGPDKKQIALDLLNSFYDRVFVVVDIPFVPSVIEPIIHRYVKTLLMIMVGASIDATVTIFRNTGVFLKKEVNL